MCSGKKSQLSRTEAFLRIAYPDRIPDRLNTEIFTNKSVEIDIMYEPKSEGAPPFCKVAAVYPSIEAGSAVAIKGDFIDVPKSSTPEFNTFAESSVKPGD
jgi:hypothetical protein